MQDGRTISAWDKLLKSIQDLWKARNPGKATLKAFISYAWEDTSTEQGKIANSNLQRYLENLRDDLQKAGISVFLDTSAMNGHIRKRMEYNLKASDVIITIHTPRFKARAEAVPQTNLGVEYELTLAKAQSILHGIFPLHYAGDFNDAVPVGLRGYLVRDCRNPATYSSVLVATKRPLGIIPAIYGIDCGGDQEYQSLIHQWRNEKLSNLPASNPYFVGREGLLTQIEKSLEQGVSTIYQQQTISGLGGIGKSSLALAYAHKHGDKYKMKRWLNVEGSNIKIEFEQLASELGIDPKGMDDMELATSVYRRIGQINTWLLVFDNADNYEAIQAYLPTYLQPGQHILITSRSQHWNQGISIDYFSAEEAVIYITNKLPRVSKEDAVLLTNTLGYLPLALCHAANYIKETERSITDYVKLYKKKGIELMQVEGHGVQGDSYPHNVLTTWSLSMEKVKQDNPQAAKVLELCSYLGPDNIPLALLESEELVGDELVVNESIRILKNYSLVGAGHVADHIRVHRLVQAVTKYRYEGTSNQQAIVELLIHLAQALERYCPPDEKVSEADFNKARVILPHLHAVIEHMDSYPVIAETANKAALAQSKLLNTAGCALMDLGDYAMAEKLYKKALLIEEKYYGKDHSQVAVVLNNLGNALRCLGDYARAKEVYEIALEIMLKNDGNEHIQIAITLENLGNALINLGNYARAKEVYEITLEINKKYFGNDHIEAARALENLGIALRNLGDYTRAKKLCERVLEIKKRHYGNEHIEVARTLENLGNALINLGDYTGARALYGSALEINKKHYGNEHTEVARTLSNLGIALRDLGDYAGAKALYERALEILKKKFGNDHVAVASTLDNLGTLLSSLGNYEEAKELYKEVLEIKKRHYGNEHIEVANALNNLGTALYSLGDYAEAKKLYKKALVIKKRNYSNEHIEVASTLSNLGFALLDSGDYEEAKEVYKEALEINKKYFGNEHPVLAMILYNLSDVYIKTQDIPRALEAIQRAYRIAQVNQLPNISVYENKLKSITQQNEGHCIIS
jgi:tetratricopeptide (TPR) repeat protein